MPLRKVGMDIAHKPSLMQTAQWSVTSVARKTASSPTPENMEDRAPESDVVEGPFQAGLPFFPATNGGCLCQHIAGMHALRR